MGSLEVWKMAKTFEEINEKIRRGEAVVVTAEEMVEIVRTWKKQPRKWMWSLPALLPPCVLLGLF
jgi:hypothetical protein